MKQYSITEAKAKLSEVLREAKKEPVLITKRGKPYRVIMSYEDYSKMRDELTEAGQWPWPKKSP